MEHQEIPRRRRSRSFHSSWLIAALMGGCLVAAIMTSSTALRAGSGKVRPAPGAVKTALRFAMVDRRVHIHLTVSQQQRLGIICAPLRAIAESPELTVYGSLKTDPASTYTLSSPVPGILVAAGPPLQIGRRIKRGERLLGIKPVIGASERVSITLELAKIRADVIAARAALRTTGATYRRALHLYHEQQAVSKQSVQIARAKMVAQKARLAADQRTARMIARALQWTSTSQATLWLRASHTGVVRELPTRAGEFVAANQPLLIISDFHRLLAELALRPSTPPAAAMAPARIQLLGQPGWLLGKPVGLGPHADRKTRGLTALYLVTTDRNVRPDMAITGYLQLPGPSRKGVLIPRSAIVWRRGERWVYVRRSATVFIPIMLGRSRMVPGGIFLAHGLRAGQMVAVRGTQLLLSLELSGQIKPSG